MKERVFFEKDTRWRERITEAKGYLGGKIRTVMLSRIVDEDGSEDWRVLEEPAAGTPIHTFSRVRTREEANREKSRPTVSSSLRRTLEMQKQASLLNRTGKLLLALDRQRGGRKPKFKTRSESNPIGFLYRGHHTIWIYQEWKEFSNRKNVRLTQEGKALKLTEKAQDLGYLRMDKEITIDDVKNALRAIRKKS